eukprot:gene29061-32266_t
MRAAKAAGSRKGASRSKLFRVKVISMGDTAVGVDYGVKPNKYQDFEVRVNLWDLAGSEDYVEVRNEFYKDAQGCVLCYDCTNRASFEALGNWLAESQECGAENMVIFVAATKCDIPARKVTEKEGRDWATSHGFQFFECSASSGQGVKALFSSLFARMLATIGGIPQELASLAVQQAKDDREES